MEGRGDDKGDIPGAEAKDGPEALVMERTIVIKKG
jgi:hypothetical protein